LTVNVSLPEKTFLSVRRNIGHRYAVIRFLYVKKLVVEAYFAAVQLVVAFVFGNVVGCAVKRKICVGNAVCHTSDCAAHVAAAFFVVLGIERNFALFPLRPPLCFVPPRRS